MVYQKSNKKCDTYGILRLCQENKAIKGLSFFTKYIHLHKFLAGDSLLRRAARDIRREWLYYIRCYVVAPTSICTKNHSFPTQNVHELLSLTGQKPWGMCVGVPLSIPAKIKSNTRCKFTIWRTITSMYYILRCKFRVNSDKRSSSLTYLVSPDSSGHDDEVPQESAILRIGGCYTYLKIRGVPETPDSIRRRKM